jgi:hypothetical protein
MNFPVRLLRKQNQRWHAMTTASSKEGLLQPVLGLASNFPLGSPDGAISIIRHRPFTTFWARLLGSSNQRWYTMTVASSNEGVSPPIVGLALTSLVSPDGAIHIARGGSLMTFSASLPLKHTKTGWAWRCHCNRSLKCYVHFSPWIYKNKQPKLDNGLVYVIWLVVNSELDLLVVRIQLLRVNLPICPTTQENTNTTDDDNDQAGTASDDEGNCLTRRELNVLGSWTLRGGPLGAGASRRGVSKNH